MRRVSVGVNGPSKNSAVAAVAREGESCGQYRADRAGAAKRECVVISRSIGLAHALLLGAALSAAAQGTGLTGKYYDNADFTSLVTTRVDTNINFNWGTSLPSGTALTNADTYSVAWIGQIDPEFSELYTFYVTADDTAKLWVDDQMIVGRAFYGGELRGQMRLKAGHRVNLRLEYTENIGNANVMLEWASSSRLRQVIPTARLYPAQEIPNGGALLREVWTGLAGTNISAMISSANYPSKPASREFLTSFECLATNWDDSFGTRVTGYVRAPTNGTYTFAVSGDDVVQLFLSTNTTATAKSLIASVASATGFRVWTGQPSQVSSPVTLASGQRCYVELLHKEDAGADHWSVGWKKPGDSAFSVIPGTVLMSPNTEANTPSSSSLFNTLAAEHPYLGVSRERFIWLKQMYLNPASSGAKSRAQAIISTANSDLTAALDSGRYGQDRVERLAVAWWLTGNTNYAERAWENINYAITSGDWTDPWKGLTDGYVALGYDWLYPYWSQARKDAMVAKMVACFSAGWTDSYGNNIGIILNSGHLMATLAVGMTNEVAAEPKLNSAIGRLASKVIQWNVNAGAWYEGTDYGIFSKWGFGQAAPAMEMALGSTWSLGRTAGVSMAAREPLTIASNTRHRFTFCDVGTGSEAAIGWANWFARRFNATEVYDFSRQAGNSALNALMVPETTISPGAAGLNPDTAFRGPADASPNYNQEVVTLREKWDDGNATFVGCMGGSDGTFSHDMMQSGTFQLVARNKRWFYDLSSESYDVPNHNTATPNPNGRDRWDYYRNRAEAHNTIVVNPDSGPDRVYSSSTRAIIRNFQSAPQGQRSFAVFDLTPKISGATRVHRGFQLLNSRKQLLVLDEIVMSSVSVVWWFAHYRNDQTTVTLSPDGTGAMLQQGAERLWCKIISGGGTWSIRAAEPLPTSPNPFENTPNSLYSKLTVNLAGVTNTTLAVWFVPLASGESEPTNTPAITPLSAWDLVAQNEPPVAKNGVATVTHNVSVDVELRNLATDDWTYPTAMAFAVTNALGGSVTLLADGHTARFSPATNATGDVSFDFIAVDEGALRSSPATVTVGVAPVTYVWTNVASGIWSAGSNWSNSVAPVSSHGTRVEFFTGQALSTGALSANNNLGSSLLLNALVLGGSSTNTRTVTVSGARLDLVSNGLTSPSVTLDGVGSGLTYTISNAVTLADDTVFYASNSGRFIFEGAIGGPGGLTRSNTLSTLILSGNNTYAGPTVIAAGTLQIGNGGASGSLGAGDVVNSGTLRITRSGTVFVPNVISGTGGLTVANPANADTVCLGGDNAFTGAVTVSSGSLRVSDSAQLGSGAKTVTVSGSTATLQLDAGGGDIFVPDAYTFNFSNPYAPGALVNLEGNSVIEGPIYLVGGAGGTCLTVSSGTLTLLGNVAPTYTGRHLDLRGAGHGSILGDVIDGSGVNILTGLSKNESGTWTLVGSNAYSGPTTVNGGALVVNGSLSGTGSVTVASAGLLAGSGTIAPPTSVSGALSPGDGFGTLTFGSNLTFGAASRLRWELSGKAPGAGDLVSGRGVAVTAGAKVDVLLNSPGSAVNLAHAFWRSGRSWPVLAATSQSGAFALGTNTADAAGHAVATYGAFSVTNSASGASLLWAPLPGFPVINDPAVSITAPAASTVALPAGVTSLKVAAAVSSGGGSRLGALWTQVSGPGEASFDNASSTNTTVRFSDEGTYELRCTATNEVGQSSAGLTVVVSPNPPWRQSRITFAGYDRAEALTNFPALVVLGAHIPGFDYADFLSEDGSDLRMLSSDGVTQLNYEIEDWNPGGLSHVWVQVPRLTNGCSVIAHWGDPSAADPLPCTTNGAAWANGFIGVWHLGETLGAHFDSSPRLSASRLVQVDAQGTAAGIAGGCDDFNSASSNYVSLPDMGTNAQVTVECWVNLNAAPGAADVGLVSSDPWSAGVMHFKTSSSFQIKAQVNGGTAVLSAPNVVSVGSWFYAAYTIAGSGSADMKLFLNAKLLGSGSGSSANNLTDVNIAREYSGRYLNARVDEVRISSVARSTNWLWAVYQNLASNATFAVCGATTLATNTPPALAPITNRAVSAGVLLAVANSAADVDAPPQSLTYSLLDAPSGVAIDAEKGILYWRPSVGQSGAAYPITVSVEDDGLPSLSAKRTFSVAVKPVAQPVVAQPQFVGGHIRLSIAGDNGPDYSVQASTNLVHWATVLSTNSPALPFNWTDPDTLLYRSRFYRILIGP